MGCLIAAIVATLLVVPILTTDRVPPSTLLATDTIEFEYTQRTIDAASGIVERVQTLESQVLEIDDSGYATLHTASISETASLEGTVDADSLHRLRALVKETGFIEITPTTFLPQDQPGAYDLYTLSVTLNGMEKSVRWSVDGDGENFVPPIVTMIQNELDEIRSVLE